MALVAFFTPNYEYLSQMSSIPTTSLRVTKANHMIRNFKTILVERELKSSSYFAVKQLIQCMEYKESFLTDLQADFKEVLVNGTLNANDLATECGINFMANRSINSRLGLLSNVTEEQLHLITNFTIMNTSIYQSNDTGYDSFYVDMEINIKMDAGIARWDSNNTVTTSLKVEDYEDPYYLGNANYSNKIYFSNKTSWTRSEVFDFIDDINYTHEELAPSFLMRFENNSNASECCGIESFINPYELNITNDVPWSYVDFCFYGQNCPGAEPGNKSIWNITGISSVVDTEKFYMFKIEIYHMVKYNLTEYADKQVVCEGECI